MESKEEKPILLLPILGNRGVGKSVFFKKALNKFDKNRKLVSSTGLDWGTYEPFFFKIMDTSGADNFMKGSKFSDTTKYLYMAKLYILMYDALNKESYQTKTFTYWVDYLQEGKKHFKVSKKHNYFFLSVDEAKEKNKVDGIGNEAKEKNKVDGIGKVLEALQKIYISKCPNYVFTDLGTIDIIQESPEKILSKINEFVETNKLRETIFQKQKTYYDKIMSKDEKELDYYKCTII